MQREILFKAKRKDNGQWVEGDLITGVGYKKGEYFILPIVLNLASLPGCHPLDGYEIDPDTVCRHIGTSDKTGKKVFEGDYDQNYQVVSWCDRRMGWAIKTFDHPTKAFIFCNCLQCVGNFDITHTDFNERVEIIGNIHDKKEGE